MFHVYVVLLMTAAVQKFHVAGFAIAPPSWSDPKVNPCAKMSNGWQHLYYAPLKECFKIFTLGYPCPESMELSPILNGLTGHGECKCPPGTAQLNTTSTCHKIFERGPCNEGHYLNPLPSDKGVKSSFRFGECKKLKSCPAGKVHWPEKDGCFELFTRGSCVNGKLLSYDENLIPKCQCSDKGALAKFYHRETRTCHRHYTQGICPAGKLFLPSKTCGCDSKLPHYFNQTNQCYELNTSGPCPNHGYDYAVIGNDTHASCKCKDSYVLMQDGLCYRKYTKGPCDNGQVIADTKTCIANPCQKNFLYFPQEQTCYRIGSQGPCQPEQVVVFDFTVKVGLDGISYNGMCGCSGIIKNLDQSCLKNDDSPKTLCDSPLVEFKGDCYSLYSKGPCNVGQWLEPSKNSSKKAKCQCKPGYVPYDNVETEFGVSGCHGPSVLIARFLNGNKTYKFGFQRWNQVEIVA